MYLNFIKNSIAEKLDNSLSIRGISWEFCSDFDENILPILEKEQIFGNYKIIHTDTSETSRIIKNLQKRTDDYSIINGIYYFTLHRNGILSSSFLKLTKKEYRNYKLESLLL